MSSEAAYFPDALASSPEMIGLEHSAPEVPAEFLNETISPIEVLPRPNASALRISEISDELLLEQVRDGAKDALAFLFRRHARSVRNVAYRILRNEAEADDLVQEVFLFIFRKAALFDVAGGAARSWIFQVAYHRAFDRRRHLTSRNFYTNKELEDIAFRLADPRKEPLFHELSIEGIFGKEMTARFNARLTAEQRETIQLFFFEGYALREIAELTGRSLVNVRNHYYRGLERLRKYVLPEKMRSR
ncbi:MAG: RNA polymerase sigma factor [Terracidiphilus sp.]|jgi:RNA polymerase sigma-70 factor (ECF subfamily)